MICKEEAIRIAKAFSDSQGWVWKEPVLARRTLFNLKMQPRWIIFTNVDQVGFNIRIVIDEKTREIVQSGFSLK